MPYRNPEIETMDPKDLRQMQSEKLVKLVKYVYDRSPFYKKRFDEFGVKPEDIKSIDDLGKLPFTMKQDLRDTYPNGMFCVKNTDVVRYHASSGTTGKPTVVGYTQNDLDLWAESLARGMTAVGLSEDDIIQVSYGYGLFTGGLGVHYGSEKIGATTLPASSGNTERQITLMKDLDVTAICCTPSYFSYLIEAAEQMDCSIKNKTKLRVGIFGAEPWSESLRKRIEERSGIKAYDVFGTSELSGPLFIECEMQEGMHIWSDMFLFEILDPETNEPVPDGTVGELVVTTLMKEALPLVRYRVGDLASLETAVCKCGRTHPRLMRLKGRSDDMVIVRGINVFPGQVEYVLVKFPEVSPHFMIVIDREGELDNMAVQVELADMASDKLDDYYKLKSGIQHELKSILNLHADVEFVAPGTIPRSEGKAKRVIDKRQY
ncbi:phenylacetate--CoA ligase family protein [Methanimicrococcus blatticola]|uniref:Phenylacetate-CoA ligase n=1 Tax=Methanimicrococcus blatticola TaxID=91560 RepID=A0A484F2C7_9EURY|nr:phenylacetate--CoA ligase [Methanimicrococcus blatticola]MBZ3935420.1 phenylacetate--CoA ligase [Methanimicrococcus blatticola]MCC2508483.1 phenylacetate--CoA ligase [Methanimicrococcus blatticola]TDQ67791.1 phenylacetate-CoA ligase [Methanimicrococcus blatticola]